MDAGGVSEQVFSETLWEENAMESLEEQIAAAGRTVADDAGVRAALAELVAARTRRTRSKRRIGIGLGVAGVLLLGGVGAAVAAGAFDWVLEDPDYSIARDWHDVEGNYLGSCEERVDIDLLDEQVRPVVAEWFATHDLDSYLPEPSFVAAWLYFRGDPGRLPELISGEHVDAYRDNIQGTEGSWPPEMRAQYSDAKILHSAFVNVVHREILHAVFDSGLEAEYVNRGIAWSGEIHCTTDPDTAE